MRVYATIFLSSLLLIGTAVRAQKFEISSTLPAVSPSISESFQVQANRHAVHADRDSNVLPERGSGR